MGILVKMRSIALRIMLKMFGSHELFEALYTKLRFSEMLRTRALRQKKNNHLLTALFKTKIVAAPLAPKQMKPAIQFQKLCQAVQLKPHLSGSFYYNIDPFCRTATPKGVSEIGNVTIDYASFLRNGFLGIEEKIRRSKKNHGNAAFLVGCENVVNVMREFSKRIQVHLHRMEISPQRSAIIDALSEMESQPAGSFHAALQRVLFLNQLLWQCGHLHNGLGRMDQYLLPFYLKDLESGKVDRDGAIKLVEEFLGVLNEDYLLKSSDLLGDTGQIIVIGGAHEDGADACNDLTEIFLCAVGNSRRTDPKILFRVSKKTPSRMLDQAVDCLRGRTGSPLFANDDVIIPILIEFGYARQDALNYASAACWEPLVPGKSLDQGNIGSLNFLKALTEALDQVSAGKQKWDIGSFQSAVEANLLRAVDELVEGMNKIRWKPSPLMSLFMDDCIEKSKDVSEGGAVYNHYGFTTVGIGNLVDSLVNLKAANVGNDGELEKLLSALKENFVGSDALRQKIRTHNRRYGNDDAEVVETANHYTDLVQSRIQGVRNRFGGRFKFGLSSPDYISASVQLPASPDGRQNGEAMNVHISCNGGRGVAYTDVVRFASKLNYSGHRFNGNLVDLILHPAIVDSSEMRFRSFIEGAIRCGVFQMQMTLVDSETIRQAMAEPEKYPNLIVRVWGFSAYFKDLPRDYQYVVLERTLLSESASR